MRNKLIVVLSLGGVLFAYSQLAFASSCGCGGGQSSCYKSVSEANIQQTQQSCEQACEVTQVATQEPVKVGNKICPVMGGKVNEKITYEYEGKIYNFCCSMCIPEFKKDPQKYIKKLEEELKSETK